MPFRSGQKINKVEILTPLQKRFLKELFSDTWFRRHFYLTGGTALSAFYLHHRYSEDLDFFSHGVALTSIPPLMKQIGKTLDRKVEQVQTSPTFMRFFLGKDLKVDLVADVGFRIGAPELIEDYMVDSLKNIAVNKVVAMLGRLEIKDYIDLYVLLKRNPFDIFELFELGQQKDAGLDPFIWASLISDVRNFSVMPKMVEPITFKEVEAFFLGLRDKVLKSLKPEE